MGVILKRGSVLLVVLSLLLTYLIMGIDRIKEVSGTQKSFQSCVIIDAGHGAPDGGAVGESGVMEKDINLAIAFMLRDQLKARGINTVLTRESDTGLHDPSKTTIKDKKRDDLKKRREILNSGIGDIFVSIHLNKFQDKKSKGAQVFYSSTPKEGETLAQCIQDTLKEQVDPENHRLPQKADSSIFILKSSQIPSVIVECGFLSNPEDEKKLQEDQHQEKLAIAIAEGIVKFKEQ